MPLPKQTSYSEAWRSKPRTIRYEGRGDGWFVFRLQMVGHSGSDIREVVNHVQEWMLRSLTGSSLIGNGFPHSELKLLPVANNERIVLIRTLSDTRLFESRFAKNIVGPTPSMLI